MVAQRPSVTYQALIGILSAGMVGAMLSSLTAFWKMNLPASLIWGGAMMMAGYGWLLWRMPKTAMFTAWAAIAGTGYLAYYLPSWSHAVHAAVQEAFIFWEQVRMLHLDTTFGNELGYVFLCVVGLAMAVLITGEALGGGKSFWSIAGGTLIFGTQWAWFYDRSWTYFLLYSVAAFALWVVGQAAKRDAQWIANGRRIGYRSHVAIPIALVLVLSILASILPSQFEPVDLGRLGDQLQTAIPVLKQMRGAGIGGAGGRFSLRTTGFSPNISTLGGTVKLDATPALKLTVDQPLKSTAYLRGATFQVYDGKSWGPGNAQTLELPPDGSLPTSLGSDVLKEYLTFKVTPLQNLGTTLFSMLEPVRVEELRNTWRADSDSNLWSERGTVKGASYTVSVRRPIFSAEQIRLLSTAAPGEAMKPYLQLPSALPKRVGELARSITGAQQHPFDKALAIEASLRGLTYSLDVPSTPSGRDFVDYFLFDLQRGYCVYSATAMAVMLRQIGIPTRMVEGFAVPASAEYAKEPDGKATYTVLNSQAHAWVEAHFPGYGWVTFDPTPRADLPQIDRSTAAPRSAANTPDASTDDKSNPNDSKSQDARQQKDDSDMAVGGDLPVRREWPWALSALLLAAGLVTAGYRRLRSQNQLAARDERHLVQEAWEKSGTLLGRFGSRRRPDQTAIEYARTVGDSWPELSEPARRVAQDYTAARYAPPAAPADPEAPSRARALWTAVREQVFNRVGWRTYLWKRLGPGK